MNKEELETISSNADMIVCGYAFSKTEDSNIRIIDLREPHHATVLSNEGEVLETTMEDVELNIILDLWKKNKRNYVLSVSLSKTTTKTCT